MRQWNYLLDILGQNSFSLLGELRGREGNYGTLLVWSDETTDIGGGGGESRGLNNAFLPIRPLKRQPDFIPMSACFRGLSLETASYLGVTEQGQAK